MSGAFRTSWSSAHFCGRRAEWLLVNLDPHNWSPLSVDEVATAFEGMPVAWWIAGGWALDLFVGKTTRPHEDIDVLILRRDQLAVQKHLCDWQLFKTRQPDPPHLAPWPTGEFLEPPMNDIWGRREMNDGPWCFQIMLMETEGDRWVYRRLPTIGGSIADMGLTTDAGIPYLAPEIQLLYKSATGLQKDTEDLVNVLPVLTRRRAEWLLNCLRCQYPDGHAWIGEVVHRALRAE
jgi:hypothetical protein